MVDLSVENLWTIKAILKGFELVSGLGVNSHKSSLIKTNVDLSLFELAEGFLHCKIESLPFRYLELSVGVNPRLKTTQEPLISLLHKRLNSWRHKIC